MSVMYASISWCDGFGPMSGYALRSPPRYSAAVRSFTLQCVKRNVWNALKRAMHSGDKRVDLELAIVACLSHALPILLFPSQLKIISIRSHAETTADGRMTICCQPDRGWKERWAMI